MRKSFLFSLFSLSLIAFLVSCSDEEKIDYGPYVNPNDQVLTITQNEVTASTFTFSVEAKDPDIPYVALYIDKTTIDGVAKSDLPEYLMGEMESQASALGKTLESHLDSISVKGNIEQQKITKLLPNQIYELVAFAFSGTEPAKKAETLFFETMKADVIDCSFTTEMQNVLQTTAGIKVVPSISDREWYVTVLLKDNYEQYKNYYTDSYIINNIFEQQFMDVLAQLAEGDINKVTDKLINEALDKIMFEGEKTLTFENLSSNTEFVYLIAAYERVNLTGMTESVLISEVTPGSFTTLPYEDNGMTFDINVELKGAKADISVIPSDKNEKFAWVYESFNEENKDYTAEQMAEMIIKKNSNFPPMFWANYQGDQHVNNAGITLGSKNYVIAFGYNNGITCKPEMYVYDGPVAGDPSKVNITFNNSKSSAYETSVTTTADDNTILYSTILVEADAYNETEYIAAVEANIIAGYQNYIKYNPDVTLESYLYAQSDYAPGEKYLSFRNLKPETEYVVAAYALDIKGKVVKTFLHECPTVALSGATVTDKYEGVFNGNELTDVFGDGCKGKAVIAMRYLPGENSNSVKFSVDMDNDKITDSKDDYFILTQYVNEWHEIFNDAGLAFVTCDWNNKYYSFSYAKDGSGVEGQMKRTYLDGITMNNVGSKEQFMKLYNESNGISGYSANIAPWQQKPAQKYIKADVVSVKGGVNPYDVKLRKIEPSVNKVEKKFVNTFFRGELQKVKSAF